MKRFCIVLIILISNIINIHAQGTLRGKVTDENGEPVIGGLVVLKNNKLIASSTDLDGNYSLKIPDSTSQVVVVSYIGYLTVEENISLKNGQILIKNFDLKSSTKEIKELVVEGKASRAKDYYLDKMKINSVTSIDFVSSETIKKTGDATAAAAVARVSGVSSSGAFITVRGIGDRYVKTQINGLVIPTLDPLTNNIKLDLFPSSLLDNIFITKTASADLAGDFSGALISLETKDFPDRLMVNVESTVGYNSQSTFRQYVSSERSSTEWLGYDSDLRDIDHLAYQPVIEEPTVYQQLVVLGLEDFYNAIGVNKDTPWSDDYFKLGLVQLGLLDKGQFNDLEAVNAAKNTFNSNNENRNKAYRAINAKASAFGKSLPNNWDTKYRVAPLNFSQSFSIGNQVNLFKRPLGIIGGFRYSSAVQYDSVSDINRLLPADINGPQTFILNAKQQSTKETNGLSGLLQLTYKVHPNHTIGLLFMPNILGVNNVRTFLDSANGVNNVVVKDQFYEQRRQLVYQTKTQHYFPALKSKLNFNLSYTNGKSVAPDFKSLAYALLANNQNAIGGGFPIRRFYRYLNEDLLDANIKIEVPLFEKPNLARKLKFGGSFLNSMRESRQYEYFYAAGPFTATGFENEDLQGFFNLSEYEFSEQTNLSGLPETTINKSYLSVDLDSYHTIGRTNIYSGYALLDYTIVPRLRASAGARIEYTNIYADVFKFDSIGYEAFDERRFQPGDAFMVNPGVINQANLLPSLNVIYKLRNKETSPINLRVNYSKTIARPSVRELTETTIFDYEYRNFIFGNADLKTVDIHNYDLRLESYFENGDNISVSFFYKKFFNHIELVQTTQGFSWQNANESDVKGIELDGRKLIMKGLEFRANLTLAQSITEVIQNNIYVKNNIKVVEPFDTLTRQMSGQAPYVINGIISYTMDSLRLSTSIAYNVQGPRLSVVSSQPGFVPDVFELPRHMLDFRIAKELGKRFAVTVTIKDILNSPVRRSYQLPEGFTADFDRFRYGTNYNLSISYKL